MTQPSPTAQTIASLLGVIRQLSEADRVRVLQFAQAILSDRQGKRQQRRMGHGRRSPPIDDWKIGN